MEPSHPEPGMDITRLLLKCHLLEKELAAAADLSVDEFHCLCQLYEHAPCCVKTLCELLEVHPTRASRLLHDLELRGYLTRSLGFPDKRKELVTLTDTGLAAARTVLQSSALSVRHLVEVLSDDSAHLLVAALRHKDTEIAH
jgi:DNA-binding MarR family transcriptional regulator